MTNVNPERRLPLTVRGLLWRCAVIAGSLVVVGSVLAVWRNAVSGTVGVQAAALAAGICLVGAVGAFLATALVRSPQAAVGGVLLGMMFRMGLPLIVLLSVVQQGGALLEGGLVICFLICYAVGLVAETLLVLPLAKNRPGGSPAGRSASTMPSGPVA